MNTWFLKGLRTGIVTTPYPDAEDATPGVTPGLPRHEENTERAFAAVSMCPTRALVQVEQEIVVDYGRCVHCFRCRGEGGRIRWEKNHEWAERVENHSSVSDGTAKVFSRSLHIRVVDAGACGTCLSEIEQLNKPYYNIHRLGFFVTPTPREADVLMVAGPVTGHMRTALLKAYEAMPTPKAVIAVGACALSGGVFGPSFASGGGVSEFIPVDVMIPGCPPPPLAIIHGLLLLTGRKKPSTAVSRKKLSGGENHA